MKLEIYHDDDACSTELRVDPVKSQPKDTKDDLESLLEKYDRELLCTLESIRLESERATDSDDLGHNVNVVIQADEDDDDDDDCFAEVEKLSTAFKPKAADAAAAATREGVATPTDGMETKHPAPSPAATVEDLEARNKEIAAKWRRFLREKPVRVDLHHPAMRVACQDKDMSPFLLGRLSELCCNEYQCMVLTGTRRRLHNDYRVLVNWFYEQIEEEEGAHREFKRSYEARVQQARENLICEEKKKMEDLRESLLAKKAALLKKLEDAKATKGN